MLNKPDLRDVTFADICAIRENQITESHTLDYKRDFPFEPPGRVSLAADVVAFANTRGGDLILGADEKGGVIVDFAPIQLSDPDKDLLTLQSALTDLIEPKVPGIHLRAIPVPDGGYIVVVRTPPSYQAPHRVRKGGAFYTRTSTGNDQMDITTLRSAFLQSAVANEKARAFRQRRIDELRTSPLRAPLPNVTLAVVHVLPLSSILSSEVFDIDTLYAIAQQARPLRSDGGWGPRITFDGVMSASAGRDETYSYTQFFRDGAVESVMPIQYGSTDVAWVGAVEDALDRDGHHAVLTNALSKLGLDGPAFVTLSFVDIGGRPLELGNSPGAAFSGSVATVPSFYQHLLLPERYVESFTSSPADIYGPLIDLVWNAAGRRGRPKGR